MADAPNQVRHLSAKHLHCVVSPMFSDVQAFAAGAQYAQQFANHYAQQQQQQQTLTPELRQFWQQQMQEIQEIPADPSEFKNHQLPLARIKKVTTMRLGRLRWRCDMMDPHCALLDHEKRRGREDDIGRGTCSLRQGGQGVQVHGPCLHVPLTLAA